MNNKTLELIKKYDIKAKKSLGQNFLFDDNVLQQIVYESKVDNKEVVEIGPGLGSMTYILLPVVKELTCYEVDEQMINILNQEIDDPKLTLIKENFLTSNFSEWKNKKTIVANIPYYITSDILFKIFDNIEWFDNYGSKRSGL